MELPGVRRLFAFNEWANERMLSSVSSLSPEELRRELGGSFGSLWGTLVHIVGVEWLYPQRWRGTSPSALPKPDGFVDLAALRAFWREVRAEQLRFLDGLEEERLQQAVEYVSLNQGKYAYPLVDQMRHLVNHSTYHRGQVTLQLRQLGKKPTSTDYLLYLDESNEGRGSVEK